VAGNTYASSRVKVVFDEVLRYEPDLIVIYSGNNEFLEDFVYTGVPRLPAPWRHSALARALARLGKRHDPKHIVDVTNYGAADQVANRLSFAFGRSSRRRTDPDQLQTVADHYRFNLEPMVAAADRAGVAVALLDVPVNLKDWISQRVGQQTGSRSGGRHPLHRAPPGRDLVVRAAELRGGGAGAAGGARSR